MDIDERLEEMCPGSQAANHEAVNTLVGEGRLTRGQGDALRKAWNGVLIAFLRHGKDEFEPVDGLNDKEKIDMRKLAELIDEGDFFRIRNGVTMDSGSAVFVMPTGWLRMFALSESAGSKRGQKHQAAAKGSEPILNEGERTVKFVTADGAQRHMTCEVADVNKILASVGVICDGGNEVRFYQHGGEIIHLKTGKRTPFRRHGNVYVMDAWLPKGKADDGSAEGLFSRPGVP